MAPTVTPIRRSRSKWMKLTSAETLVALMRQRGVGYEKVARYAGVSKGFISHLAKGRKTTCTKQTADRIAEFLSVPREILFVEQRTTDSGRTNQSPRRAA